MPSSMARPMSSGVARLAPETKSRERTATALSHVYERRYARPRSEPAPKMSPCRPEEIPYAPILVTPLTVAFGYPAVMVTLLASVLMVSHRPSCRPLSRRVGRWLVRLLLRALLN